MGGLLSRLSEEKKTEKSGLLDSAATREITGFERLKEKVHTRLIDDMPQAIMVESNIEKKRQMLRDRIMQVTAEESPKLNVTLAPREMEAMCQILLDDMIGYGPIQKLLDEEDISEVMVNGPYQIYYEKKGKLILSDIKFKDNDHVMRIIERIVAPIGRRIDESVPYVDARLPDGSRVNAIIPPLALNGPTITIRKFKKEALGIQDLIRFGTLTEEMAKFLEACIKVRLNIVVSGGTGSGKTTTLNILSSFIPEDERIITCEDAAELQLRQPHVVRLETRPPNIEGKGAVTMRDLIKNTLRMRPERVIVGECRGGEALDMLQAMNTGHDGSLTTGHANTPRDMLARLETMVLMAGMDLPVRAIREQIASAVHLIIQQSRLKDGSRKITYLTEIQGMEGDKIVMQDIFRFEQTGVDAKGKILGRLKATGIRPKFASKFEEHGIHLPPNIFTDTGKGW
ncbi:MAG: Type II/IV secretion system ATP hydrolase TadA/VirB11/CpaF, TadA subfamily [Candidatus Ozemobacter sibiricus]|uniref:Type II/IV secretion system ATP hydrolase TadA/VirB11/CpaF, TadA subfamily n=1 Tax=Candidatus Ozemobacter sibiricus TaxID=2268124 RepID=A0A367ZQ67_9BACT|nr:MAG: Type II/IV secretion system ATP hydrolase TadA/VirB11/CpaF, TadA subfamily [Candidatus Ozemobacter sibiricus]